MNTDGSVQHNWARFPGATSELTGHLDRSQSPHPMSDFDDPARRAARPPFPVEWVGGACFLVRWEAVVEAGLLDEGFFLYGEEVEWCHRFQRGGWQVLLAPSVSATHHGGASAARVPLASRTHLYRSALRLYRILYGAAGAAIPSALAALRYVLFRLRRALRGRPDPPE